MKIALLATLLIGFNAYLVSIYVQVNEEVNEEVIILKEKNIFTKSEVLTFQKESESLQLQIMKGKDKDLKVFSLEQTKLGQCVKISLSNANLKCEGNKELLKEYGQITLSLKASSNQSLLKEISRQFVLMPYSLPH
ncbi:MAG: hypothetical protein ACRC80_29850 [Waterburya sp.]